MTVPLYVLDVAELAPEQIVRFEPGRVVVLDQRRLPDEEVELVCVSAAEVADAIRSLAVRGAPAIGVAAAYGYALAAEQGEDLEAADAVLRGSRPTAVNLAWALDRMQEDASAEHARRIHREEVERCREMGRHAVGLFDRPVRRAHALQHGRPRNGRVRHRARRDPRRLGARPRRSSVGGRDAAAAPGRSPDGVGARAPRHPVLRHRRRQRAASRMARG